MNSMVPQSYESKGSAPLEMRWGLLVNESPSAVVWHSWPPQQTPMLNEGLVEIGGHLRESRPIW